MRTICFRSPVMLLGIAVILALPSAVSAQPKLSADNIDQVIKAMTLEEKATLCVGGGRAVTTGGVSTALP